MTTDVSATTTPAASSPTSTTPAPSSSSNFQLQNALDAQKLNVHFVTLTADASCTTDGDQACIASAFAMCVGGKFVSMGYAAATQSASRSRS